MTNSKKLAIEMIKNITGSRESDQIEAAVTQYVEENNIVDKINYDGGTVAIEKIEEHLDDVESLMEKVWNSDVKMTYND